MATIKINNEELTYNNVYYVDGVDGDDTMGNGSNASPFKTFTKAYDSCLDGDAMCLIGKEGVNYNDYTSTITKEISIIGEGILSKIDVGLSANIWSSSTKIVKIYRVNLICNQAFRNSEWTHKSYWHNCIIRANIGAVSNAELSTQPAPEFYNCDFDSRGLAWGVYRSKAKIVNCFIFGRADGWGQYGVSSLKTTLVNDDFVLENTNYTAKSTTYSYQVDSEYNISEIEWQNIGTGLNPDGTQANIGVYGGEYAWGGWYKSRILIKSNNLVYSLDISNNLTDVTSQIVDINNITQLEYETLGFDDMSLIDMTQLGNLQSPKSVIYYTDGTAITNPKLKHEYSFNIGTRLLKRG